MSGTDGKPGTSSAQQSPGVSAGETALRVLVYGPLGLLLAAKDELPKILSGNSSSGQLGQLVQRGHSTAEQQINSARVIGRLALNQAQVGRQMDSSLRRLAQLLANPFAGPGAERSGAPGQRRPPAAPQDREPAAPSSGIPVGGSPAGAGTGPLAGVESSAEVTLPTGIEGYDELSAMQVVQRLPGLSASELRDVVAYEEATRQRRTVLTKARQLLNDPKRS